ncbi:MAG: AI-2E family transporter [Phycisphaerae bacterium]|nr:AI-2E family transporter [Phycisphaerae bacterium]
MNPGGARPKPGTDWRSLHVWQIQPVRDALAILAVCGVLYLGYRLSVVTVPILLAMLLAYLFEPVVCALTRTGRINRPFAAAGIIVLSGALIVVPATVGLGFGVVQGASYVQSQAGNVQTLIRSLESPDDPGLRGQLPGGWQPARDWLIDQRRSLEAQRSGAQAPAPPSPWALAAVRFVDYLRANTDTIARRAVQAGADAFSWILRFTGALGQIAFGAVLTAFFFYFFCTGWGKVLAFWGSLIPERRKGRTIELIRKMDRVIAAFVRGRLTICACQIVLFTFGYWLIGVPAPLIVGPLVGVLTLAPFAAALGMPVAMLMMALDPAGGFRGEWWWIIAGPVLMQAVSQVMDDYVLTPSIQGKATDMSVPMILFASIAGGVLAGFYGLLLAIPAAACARILLKEVFWPRFRAWAEGRERDFLPIQR